MKFTCLVPRVTSVFFSALWVWHWQIFKVWNNFSGFFWNKSFKNSLFFTAGDGKTTFKNMNFPVNVPKETWKRKWVMIVKSCFCSLLLRSMLHVQKSTIPELWIFHWNFTVCMWLQPEGCTKTSVYDASQQNKLQHGLNLIPRSPYATQLYLFKCIRTD